ncbi:FHA domain-containing protein [candidate division KSB1 bacterium]|nr:FHA domain-containing protein [candidate division KSB1 bacterium]
MRARLFCKTGQLAGAEYLIALEATIGKGVENSIVLYPGIVSSRHARIFFDENEKRYCLEDLGSRNGTKLDGVKITQKQKLRDLHVITFAENFDFIFQVVDDQWQKVAAREEDLSGKLEKSRGAAQRLSRADTGFVAATPHEAETKTPLQEIERTIFDNVAIAFPKLQEQEKPRATQDMQKTSGGEAFVGMPGIPADHETKSPDSPGSRARGYRDYRDKTQEIDKTMIGEPLFPMPDLRMEEEKNATKTSPRQGTFFLEMRPPDKETKTFQLHDGENIVGRLPECDLYIDDASISRKHAVLTVLPGKVMVKDLDSKNGTFINEKAIGAEAEIRLETRLKFGVVEAHLSYKK